LLDRLLNQDLISSLDVTFDIEARGGRALGVDLSTFDAGVFFATVVKGFEWVARLLNPGVLVWMEEILVDTWEAALVLIADAGLKVRGATFTNF